MSNYTNKARAMQHEEEIVTDCEKHQRSKNNNML